MLNYFELNPKAGLLYTLKLKLAFDMMVHLINTHISKNNILDLKSKFIKCGSSYDVIKKDVFGRLSSLRNDKR